MTTNQHPEKKAAKQLRICPQGHRYYKSSDCPVCPQCESLKNKDYFVAVNAPVRRALQSVGIRNAADLARFSKQELLDLHGMGKSSLPLLEAALQKAGLGFKA